MAKIAYKCLRKYLEVNDTESYPAKVHECKNCSTGTKNQDYSDIKYIEAVVGKNTINTIPPDILNAYRSHGKPALCIKDHIKRACWVMSELSELGIDIDSITKKLETDGVGKFIKAFDKLMERISKKSSEK